MLSNYLLTAHERGYALSIQECLTFAFTAPYAERHLELSQTGCEAYRFGHKILAVIERVPIVGLLASLMERIVAFTIQIFHSWQSRSVEPSRKLEHEIHPLAISSELISTHNEPSSSNENELPPIVLTQENAQTDSSISQLNETPAPASSELAKPELLKEEESEKKIIKTPEQRMLKNLCKAIVEHGKKQKKEEIKNPDELSQKVQLLSKVSDKKQSFTFYTSEKQLQGRRREMEDAHFYKKISEGYLFGICDGHGEEGRISSYISNRCQQLFSEALKKNPNDMIQVFSGLFEQIHAEVIEKPNMQSGGSTVILCFIDKQNRLYTATLGDSEAKIIRKEKGFETIPLSCVRDWSSKRDAQRAANALNNQTLAETWPAVSNSKYLRFPYSFSGVNVSRAIGDKPWNVWNDYPGVIQKPKVTVCQLQENDLVILACDGVWDYIQEDKELETLVDPYWLEYEMNLAEVIAKYAYDKKGSGDNISVITFYAGRGIA